MSDQPAEVLSAAAAIFQEHGFEQGEAIASHLNRGLAHLRDLLYMRLHADIEDLFGVDSMLMPVSESKARLSTWIETDLYQVAESALFAQKAEFLAGDGPLWYPRCLAELRIGKPLLNVEHFKRIEYYTTQHTQPRRLAFSNVMVRVMPEAQRAPLVLFRLFPKAIYLVTAAAFGHQGIAQTVRARQVENLPAIADCSVCHGRVLAVGETCKQCGNPLWTCRWMTEND